MTLALVLLIVEVLAPAARRQWKRWMADGDRHSRESRAELGRRPGGE